MNRKQYWVAWLVVLAVAAAVPSVVRGQGPIVINPGLLNPIGLHPVVYWGDYNHGISYCVVGDEVNTFREIVADGTASGVTDLQFSNGILYWADEAENNPNSAYFGTLRGCYIADPRNPTPHDPFLINVTPVDAPQAMYVVHAGEYGERIYWVNNQKQAVYMAMRLMTTPSGEPIYLPQTLWSRSGSGDWFPNGLQATTDLSTNRVYWADWVTNEIAWIPLTQGYPEPTLLSVEPIRRPRDIQLAGHTLYWCNEYDEQWNLNTTVAAYYCDITAYGQTRSGRRESMVP